ncbi:MAG: hypothetical protein Q8S13_07960, partial [Dehalococcoidia bacterium]|nr:hypothetical protein [Dehalococcoidia bacterium]
MTARSKSLARARGQHATPLTRVEHHRFRAGVIAALRAQTNRTIHATVLEFARQLIEQHHSERPFEDRKRIGARLRKLERQGVIRYEKIRSHNYWVVRAITLVEETALEAP